MHFVNIMGRLRNFLNIAGAKAKKVLKADLFPAKPKPRLKWTEQERKNVMAHRTKRFDRALVKIRDIKQGNVATMQAKGLDPEIIKRFSDLVDAESQLITEAINELGLFTGPDLIKRVNAIHATLDKLRKFPGLEDI